MHNKIFDVEGFTSYWRYETTVSHDKFLAYKWLQILETR